MSLDTVTVGQRVFWKDPDRGIGSGNGVVVRVQPPPIEDSVIALKMDSGSEAEVLLHELDDPRNDFVDTDGFQCPECMGRNTLELSDGPVDCMGDVSWQVECHDCGIEYSILFKIAGYKIDYEGD